MSSATRKRLKVWVPIGILVAIGLLWFLNSSYLERLRFYRFDTELWLASKPEQRYFMAVYLVDHRMTIGKTKEEIFALLGRPSSDVPCAFLLYDLGPERNAIFRVDDDWLQLSFRGNRVSDARIRPD